MHITDLSLFFCGAVSIFLSFAAGCAYKVWNMPGTRFEIWINGKKISYGSLSPGSFKVFRFLVDEKGTSSVEDEPTHEKASDE